MPRAKNYSIRAGTRQVIRKIFCSLCCVSLIATGPGIRELFADSTVAFDLSDRGSQYLWNGNDLILTATPTLKDVPAVAVDLQNVSKNIQTLKVDSEMKARAQELLDRRVIPFLGNSGRRPPEVEAALRRFQSRVSDPKANRELLLLELFEGLEGFARKMEETGSRKDVLQSNDEVRVLRYSNDYTGRWSREVHYYKLTPTTQRIEAYVEDPKHKGRKILDSVAYVYTKNGELIQKLVWSRRLLDVAKSIRKTFFERPDLLDDIRDTKDPVELRRLQASLEHTRHVYEESGIQAALEAMDGAESERLKNGKFTPQELDELNKRLTNWQGTIQQFYATFQLEDYQKDVLGSIIGYFSAKAGIPNPLYKKDGSDISKMSIEDVQKILNDFEQGTYSGFGRVGDALAKLHDWFKLKYRVMDPEKDLPPAMRQKVEQMIVYLGYAADAHKRMTDAFKAGRKEERSAALDELNSYLKQIRIELQTFEMFESSITLEELRDGRSQQMRLRDMDKPEATRLISSARYDIVPKQNELAGQHETRLLEDAAAAFATRLHNAGSMKLDDADLRDHAAALAAKAKELRAIYLSRQFRKFMSNPENLKAYAREHGGGENGEYYGNKAKGGLYEFFLAHLDADTRRNKNAFDSLIYKLEKISSQSQLWEVQEQMMAIFRPLGLPEAPDAEDGAKKASKLAVAQAWLDGTVRDLKGKLEIFTKIHDLNLNIEKYASSDDTAETRDQNMLDRSMGLDWMNSWLNVGGVRHFAGTMSERIFTPKAYKMLGDPKKKEAREEIMALMRDQKYDDATQKIIDMDPEAARKAKERQAQAAARRESDEGQSAVAGWNVADLLSKGFTSDTLAQARGVLKEANNQLADLRLAYTGGTMVFDFAVMTALTPVAGAGLYFAANMVARGIAGVAKIIRAGEALAGASRLLSVGRTLAAIGKPVAGTLEFGARVFDGAANNLSKGLALPEVRNFVSRPLGASWDMAKASMGFNWRAMTGTGMMGGMIETGGYALNRETSNYNSAGEAMWKGTIQNAAWGAKGGVLFAFQTPSSAIHSRAAWANMYKYFGNTTGVLNWGADLTAWIGTKFFTGGWVGKVSGTAANWSRGMARWGGSVLKNEQTFLGWTESRIGAVKNTFGRGVLRTGMGLVSSLDNGFKFMLVFEGFQEAAQAGGYFGARHHWSWLDWTGALTGTVAVAKTASGFYSLARGRLGQAVGRFASAAKWGAATGVISFASYLRGDRTKKRETDPNFQDSEHLQAVADARRGAQAFGQIAFLLIPQSGYASSKEMARSRETRAGVDALYQRGGEQFNKFMATPANGSAKIVIEVDWRNMGLRQAIGTREVEVPATSEVKKELAEKWLRGEFANKRIDLATLIGMEMMPPTEPGKKGKGSANHQLFWTVDELRAFAAGKKVSPADRAVREAAEADGRPYDVPKDDKGVVFMIPEMREAASTVIGEMLAKDVKLAKSILDADGGQLSTDGKGTVVRKGKLELGGVVIVDPATIQSIKERARAIVFESEKEQTVKNLLAKLAGREGDIGAKMEDYARLREALERQKLSEKKINEKLAEFSKREIEPILDQVWAEAVRGRSDIVGRVTEELKEKVKTQLSLRSTVEWLERQVGSTKDPAQIARIGQQFIDRIDSALNWGHTKNQQGFAMASLRPVQRKALLEWADAIVKGDKDKASRVFVFLKASGGKTLLSYVAFVPYLQMRAEKGGRKVWLMTSNELLAEQFKADWTAYAGGIPPDFKVTSVDEAKFEEAFRLERGERSIGAEYVIAIDEADENFRKPSNSIGDPNGELSEGHPLADLRLRGLEKALEMPDGLTDKQKEAWLDQTSRELAAEWRKTMKEIAPGVFEPWSIPGYHFARFWTKKAASKVGLATDPSPREMRHEAKRLDKIAHEEFGRLTGADKEKVDFNTGDLTGASWWKKGTVYAKEGTLFGAKKGWKIVADDGVATFMRNELKNHIKTIELGEKRSEHIKIELQAGKVTPINFASAMPTLSTEYRVTAQLMAIQLRDIVRDARGANDRAVSKAAIDRISRGADVRRLLENVPVETRIEFEKLLAQKAPIEWGEAQVDNPLKNKRIPTENGQSMTLKEFFQRLKDADTDITLFSGTAGRKVKSYLEDVIGVDLVNLAGETKMPKRSFMNVDDAGKITMVKRDGSIKDLDWSSDLFSSRFKVDPPAGIAHPNPEKIRLMLRLIEMMMNSSGLKPADKTLTILAPRTMDEYKTLRKAILDSEFEVGGRRQRVGESEIVAFFPDFVQQGREEYKLDAANAENNIPAMRDGTAKVVLLVPEIGGRGTDMPFKSAGVYKKFLMVGDNVHEVAEVEDRQAKARLGENPGDRIPEDALMTFIDITSKKSLLDSEEYRAEVTKLIDAAQGKKVTDDLGDLTDFRKKLVADQKVLIDALLPKDKAALDKLKDETSPEFKDFAARGEVYKVMVELMQEKKQLEANETSGILKPSENLTKKDVQAVQGLAGIAVPVVSWIAGFGFMGPAVFGIPTIPFVSMGVNWAVRKVGNSLLKGDKVPSMSEQFQGWFKKSPTPSPIPAPAH